MGDFTSGLICIFFIMALCLMAIGVISGIGDVWRRCFRTTKFSLRLMFGAVSVTAVALAMVRGLGGMEASPIEIILAALVLFPFALGAVMFASLVISEFFASPPSRRNQDVEKNDPLGFNEIEAPRPNDGPDSPSGGDRSQDSMPQIDTENDSTA